MLQNLSRCDQDDKLSCLLVKITPANQHSRRRGLHGRTIGPHQIKAAHTDVTRLSQTLNVHNPKEILQQTEFELVVRGRVCCQ